MGYPILEGAPIMGKPIIKGKPIINGANPLLRWASFLMGWPINKGNPLTNGPAQYKGVAHIKGFLIIGLTQH